MRHGRSISPDKKMQMILKIRNAAREVIRLNGGKDIVLSAAADKSKGRTNGTKTD